MNTTEQQRDGEAPEETSTGQPVQAEMPFAIVQGAPITELPKDLYIPPQALEVFLEAFEGPLDLLLYLIKRQNIDILDIPIAEITRQYMNYIEMMHDMQMSLAGEYLVMAAMLAEIKSRMLLPRPVHDDDEEGDPRAELIRRLQEYERYKQAAEDIDQLPRSGRDIFSLQMPDAECTVERPLPQVGLKELLLALRDVMKRDEMFARHAVQRETLSIRERMSRVLETIDGDHFTEFTSLFTVGEGKLGVVVTLMAILELIKQSLVELIQTEPYGAIHIKLAGATQQSDESLQDG